MSLFSHTPTATFAARCGRSAGLVAVGLVCGLCGVTSDVVDRFEAAMLKGSPQIAWGRYTPRPRPQGRPPHAPFSRN